MRGAVTVICFFLLNACSQSAPISPVVNGIDTGSGVDLERLIRAEPGLTDACKARLRADGLSALEPVENCFQMSPRQRWRGLWRNTFEGSRFCAEPATACIADTPGEKVWLSLGDHANLGGRYGGLYAVEFAGRRTAVPGTFGHLGGSDHELIVDQLISIREVEPPTPPLTQAKIDETLALCRSAKTCVSPDELGKLVNRTD